MGVILPAETAVLAERELFFDFFLVPLGVVRDAAAYGTLEFHHRIFDLSHTSIRVIRLFTKAFLLYGKTLCSSIPKGNTEPLTRFELVTYSLPWNCSTN